jgi:hypothetical protein
MRWGSGRRHPDWVCGLEACHLDDAHAQITLLISSIQAAPRCPACNAPARHVHSRYIRTLADLPSLHARLSPPQPRLVYAGGDQCGHYAGDLRQVLESLNLEN